MANEDDEPIEENGRQQIEASNDVGKSDDSPEKARETTRSEIAKFYVYAFFAILIITFVVGLLKSFKVEDYRDMLITVSGILSGPLGFIIGYYFKASTSKES